MPAPLSYTSQFGYYGLRVNPTFEQVAGTVRKPLRIPLPDRSAKWYALSPYRALILDAEEAYNAHAHAVLDYRSSGAELPEAAAHVRPSTAGDDPAFAQLDEEHLRREQQQAFEIAAAIRDRSARLETEAVRGQQLRQGYGANAGHPVVEAAHDELVEAGVPHAMPLPRVPPLKKGWEAPPVQFAAFGQPQAPEFPTFENLNQGQPATVRATKLSPSQNLTYERAREFVVQPTWSS